VYLSAGLLFLLATMATAAPIMTGNVVGKPKHIDDLSCVIKSAGVVRPALGPVALSCPWNFAGNQRLSRQLI
jgi:hypothetical protein